MAALKALEAFKSKLKIQGGPQIEDSEIAKLRAALEQKFHEMNNDSASSDKTDAKIIDNVTEELKQKNLELSSLLKLSEQSRFNLEEAIKENNREITALKANTHVMYSLRDAKSELQSKHVELNNAQTRIEQDLSASRKQEVVLIKTIKDLQVKEQEKQYAVTEEISNLSKKLMFVEELFHEKDNTIDTSRKTLIELIDTCKHLGESNDEVKSELKNCISSNKNVAEVNKNLQHCKDLLEDQVDLVVKDLKQSRALNERLKLESANLSAEKQNLVKRFSLLSEKAKSNRHEIPLLNDQMSNTQSVLDDYIEGELKSGVVMNEIKKEQQISEAEKNMSNKKVATLESEIEQIEDAIRGCIGTAKRIDSRAKLLDQRIKHYQSNYVENQELFHLKKDFEMRYKLDTNVQRNRAKAVLQNSANDVIKTVKNMLSMPSKIEEDKDDIQLTYLTV